MKMFLLIALFVMTNFVSAVDFVIPEVQEKFDSIDSNISTNVTNVANNTSSISAITSTSEGLTYQRSARFTFDVSTDGGAISTIASGVELPDNAIVTNCWYDVITTFTSSSDAATIAFTLPSEASGDLQAAVAISSGTTYDAGLHQCDTLGTDSNDPSKFIKTTAARDLSFVVAVEELTAGKLDLFLEYTVSE